MAEQEAEYGEKTRARNQKAAAPLPQEQPAVTPEEIVQETAAVPEETFAAGEGATQEAPVAQAAQQVPVGQQAPQEGFTVRNPYMLLPPMMNLGQARKSTVERQYDIGMLWDVLAQDTQASPLTRLVAQSLMGREENG